MMGAGPDSEDVVHEALLAAARYSDLDEQRVWALLANIIAKRIADKYRRAARAQILVRHRALLQHPRWFEHEVVDRAEATWVASQLARILPPGILDVLWQHHIGGVAWAALATQRGISTSALKQRVSRAVLIARRRIGMLRD
jgi:DNA-directed RNA polymerase specialized sigma24 family protein